VLDTAIVPGGTSPRRCRPTSGRVEVCNERYGFNGWLGIAQVWIDDGHILQATSKVNDSYFNSARYNDPAAKKHVLCQEIGHTLGLDHQITVSCMNDQGATLFDPAYTTPDAHDYAELEAIYAHLDTDFGTASPSASANGAAGGENESDDDDSIPPEVRARRGRAFVETLPGGIERITFIHWAP
jgi:hypothetical protein